MAAAQKVEEDNWFGSDTICEIMANQPVLELNTINLFQSLMEHEITLCEIESKHFTIYSLTFPFAPIVLFFIPILIFTRLFIVDVKKLVNVLLNVSQQVKEEAKSPIRKDSSLEVTQASEKKPKIKHLILLRILLLIFCALNSLAFYFMLSETRVLNKNIIKLGRWNLLCSVRMISYIEIMNYLLSAVVLNGSESLNISNSPRDIATRE